MPPTWNSYITVESADDALERARELGATVHAPAFDVLDVGRMGVIQDPQGAYFMVWEPKSNIGAALVNAPGALSWNELATPDLDASAEFYGALFGWTSRRWRAETPYLVIHPDGHGNGGIRPLMPGEPPYWLVYFGVDDLDATAPRRGARRHEARRPDGHRPGRIGVVQDPQGAVFALYSGHFDE